MKPVLRWQLFVAALLICGISGCGSGGGDGGGSDTGPPGGVSGLFARSPDGKSVLVYGALPAGFTPVAGASISVAGHGGTSTGADGTFSMTNVPAGSQKLQINPKTGAASTVALTVVPDAVIRPGDPPITRDAAVVLVKQALTADQTLAGAGIWASQQPLPAGVKVGSALWFGDAKGPTYVTASTQWLVYADLYPFLRFGHEVTCYFVDAQTGALTKLDSDSWPALNSFAYYHPANTGAPASPDEVQPPPNRAAAPFAQASSLSDLFSRARAGRATGSTYALLVRGASSLNTQPDIVSVKGFFGTAPIPKAAEVDVVDTPALPAGTDPGTEIVKHFNALAAKTKESDTFVLYISSHGLIHSKVGSYQTPSDLDYHTVLEGNPGGKLDPTTLDFTTVKACNIVLIIDTCYSGMWIALLQTQLTGLPGKHVVVATSANFKRSAADSEGNPVTVGGKTVTPKPGGLYTQSLALGFLGGFAGPDLYADMSAAHAVSVPVVQAYWDYAHMRYGTDPRLYQDPQLWQRPLVDGEGCFSETVTIRSEGLHQ